jgi:hypothetical protein
VSRLALYLLGPPRFERDCLALEFNTHKTIPLVACPSLPTQPLLN